MTKQIAETVSLDYLRDMLSIRQKDFRDVTLPFGAVKFAAQRKEGADEKTTVKVSLDNGREYAFNENGTSQLASKLGIPRQYLEKLPPALAMNNINHWQKERFGDNAFWRLNERTGTVRAVLSERFADVPHSNVLDSLARSHKLQDYAVRGFELTDSQMVVRLTSRERLNIDPVIEGDGYFPGLIVRNSDVGMRTLEIGAFLYVLVCTNGLVAARAIAAVKRRHIGSINVDHFVSEGVSKAIDSPYPAAIASLAPFAKEELPALANDFDHAAMNLLLAGKGISKKFALSVAERITEKKQVKSGWNVVQAMTKVSQTLKADARQDIDDAAGDLSLQFLKAYSSSAYASVVGRDRRFNN